MKQINFERHMGWIFPLIILALMFLQLNIKATSYEPNTPAIYNSYAPVICPQLKIIRVPIVASAQKIDISGTGLNNVIGVVLQGEKNTNYPSAIPYCNVKYFTNKVVVINTIIGTGDVKIDSGNFVNIFVIGN